MKKYVALLRGIGPGDPRMRNNKLRSVFEDLGFKNVQSVISSGNILFESDEADVRALEEQLEKAWPEKLGFQSTTIIKSREQLQKLIDEDPFKGLEHGSRSYLLVTFFKQSPKIDFKFPYQPTGKTYKFIGAAHEALFSTTDNTLVQTTGLMTYMEKRFGKEITSRTWLTVHRILKKMNQA